MKLLLRNPTINLTIRTLTKVMLGLLRHHFELVLELHNSIKQRSLMFAVPAGLLFMDRDIHKK